MNSTPPIAIPVSTADVEFLGADFKQLKVAVTDSTCCICIDPTYYCTECATYGHKPFTCSCPTAELYSLEDEHTNWVNALARFPAHVNTYLSYTKNAMITKIDELATKIQNIRFYINANASRIPPHSV